MSALAKLSPTGQLTVPKEIRERLALSPGTEFYMTVEGGRLVATPKKAARGKAGGIMKLAGILGKAPGGRTYTLEEIDEAIMTAVADDDERIRREWREGHK